MAAEACEADAGARLVGLLEEASSLIEQSKSSSDVQKDALPILQPGELLHAKDVGVGFRFPTGCVLFNSPFNDFKIGGEPDGSGAMDTIITQHDEGLAFTYARSPDGPPPAHRPPPAARSHTSTKRPPARRPFIPPTRRRYWTMQTFGGKTLAQCMIEFGIGGLHDTARDIKLKFVYTSAERSREKAFILMGTKSGVQMALKRQVRRPCRQPQSRSRAARSRTAAQPPSRPPAPVFCRKSTRVCSACTDPTCQPR